MSRRASASPWLALALALVTAAAASARAEPPRPSPSPLGATKGEPPRPSPSPSPSPVGEPRRSTVEATTTFAARMAQAFAAHDAKRGAALFSTDASAALVGDARNAEGRAAIEAQLAALFARYHDVKLTIGRIWIAPTASVIEFVLGARHLGVVGAGVVTFDSGEGLVTSERLYLDVATVIGQLEPARMIEGMRVRRVVTRPPNGSGTSVAQGTPRESQNLAATNAIWAALDAHRPVELMATAADDYVYEDYSGPAPLDKAATQKLVADFLALVPDFKIAARPTQLAAGDDVISENVEHATYKGKAIVLHALDVKRFAGAKLTREWQYANYCEVLAQLFGVELVNGAASASPRPRR